MIKIIVIEVVVEGDSVDLNSRRHETDQHPAGHPRCTLSMTSDTGITLYAQYAEVCEGAVIDDIAKIMMGRHPDRIDNQLGIRNQHGEPTHGRHDAGAESAGQQKEAREPDGIGSELPQFLKHSLAEHRRKAMNRPAGKRS